jgi:hypothetical protein
MFYRGYDPATGRMLQVDPYATMYASYSGYNYALGNPVMMNDPSGGVVSAQGGFDWIYNRSASIAAYTGYDGLHPVGQGSSHAAGRPGWMEKVMREEQKMINASLGYGSDANGYPAHYSSPGTNGSDFVTFLYDLAGGAEGGTTVLSGNVARAAYSWWRKMDANQNLIIDIDNGEATFSYNTYDLIAANSRYSGVVNSGAMETVSGAYFFPTAKNANIEYRVLYRDKTTDMFGLQVTSEKNGITITSKTVVIVKFKNNGTTIRGVNGFNVTQVTRDGETESRWKALPRLSEGRMIIDPGLNSYIESIERFSRPKSLWQKYSDFIFSPGGTRAWYDPWPPGSLKNDHGMKRR